MNEILREIIIEELQNFFKTNPAKSAWAGTATQLFRLLQSNPHNDGLLRRADSLSVRGVLQDMAKEGTIQSETTAGLWFIPRSVFQPHNNQ